MRVALVTGGARGIGQAVAVALARAGCDVSICDVLPEAEATLAAVRACGREAQFFQGDVGDRAAMERWFGGVDAELGRVDVLVNNAGLNIRRPLLELDVEDAERVWNVTLRGVFHCTQLAARRMVAQKTAGAVVMIGSIHSFRPFAGSSIYNGAKAAVRQMAETWAVELAPRGIRVNTVEPGWTDTPGERELASEEQIREGGAGLPLGRLATPEEIARAAAFLASDEASYVTGACLRVDGGFSLAR